jgi:hypothetical protein
VGSHRKEVASVKATKGQSPLKCPKPGSTKRLQAYQKRLRSDATKRVFDDRVIKVLKGYAKPSQLKIIQRELGYLETLTDEKGRPFCRSIGEYADVEKQVSYFLRKDPASFTWNEHFKTAVNRVRARYPKHLRMVQYRSNSDVYNALTDWSTSAGYLGIVTGFRKKRDYLARIFEDLQSEEQAALERGRYIRPLAQASRTQGSGAYDKATGERTYTCKMKRRDVQNVCLFQVLTECRFANPLDDFLKNYSKTAIGKNDPAITAWVNRQRARGQGFISFDYSKYDSTIPRWLLEAAFDVLESCFDLKSGQERALFAVVRNSFIVKEFALPEGNVLVSHGTPSGSRLTALINGIVNEIMTETWFSALNVKGDYMIMGDDNLVALYWNGDKEELMRRASSYLTHNFGIQVNADKSSVFGKFQDPEFLSRFWGVTGPWRWKGEVLSLMAYPERFRPYKKGGLKPELVLLSYVLAYRRTMRELMDVDRFMRENRFDLLREAASLEARREMPWNVRNYLESLSTVRKYIKKGEKLNA